MRCSKCGAENSDRAKFCEECASPLTRRCPSCDTENSPTAKFCIECARAIEVVEGKSQRIPDAGSPIQVNAGTADSLEGERKTVTVLFADIKGSMELIEDLDPEEARAIVDPALKLMMEAVQHYGGYVAQPTGDGIFALFGAPRAYEDHTRRALFAALRMQQELKRYSARTGAEGRLPIQVRVGVNTGEVVVRTITTGEAKSEYVPIGHSISLAARMQSLAPIGSIAATEQVRKLCEGYFAFTALGPTKVKGVSEPVNVYEVTGLGPLRTPLQRAAARGYTKFVGRQREMDAMKHAAEMAKSGHGQIIAAVAEAGVGKSRLLFEFKAKNQSEWSVLEAVSVSHGKATAYLPLIELLHDYFGIQPDDQPRRRREKVIGKVLTVDRKLEDTLPYLFALLGIVESEDPLMQMDAQIRRHRTQEAVKRILLRESLNQPLMLIFEDLHGIDEETQGFLNLLAEGVPSAPVLLLVNYRPEYSHQWNSKTYYTQLRLDPLGKDSADEMLRALVGETPELAPLRRLVLERTEGNPLFMEELVEALFEEGALARNGTVRLTRPLSQLKIPPTVQGILAARIDRLPPEAKDLLQTLAVIGTEFSVALVREVVRLPPEQLDRLLSRLQTGEFIYERPGAGDVGYTFKHALTHGVAYGSLLTERRRRLHDRTGQAIEALYKERLDDHYADLAHHYRSSNNAAKAVKYLQLAGRQAVKRSANQEAISHFTTALRVLETWPPSPERQQRELKLYVNLQAPLMAANGYTSSEVENVARKARELCRELGDGPELFAVLGALSTIHFNRLELKTAVEIGHQMLRIARHEDDRVLLLWAHYALGFALAASGELRIAREHLEQSYARYERKRGGSYGYVQDPGPTCLMELAGVLDRQGYPDLALQKVRLAIDLARELSHPFTLAWILNLATSFYTERGEEFEASALCDEDAALCAKYGFDGFLEVATIRQGLIMARRGIVEGIAHIHEGLAIGKATHRPDGLGLLAEAHLRLGQGTQGLAAVTEALSFRNYIDSRGAWLNRLKGELLLIQDTGNEAQAESSFRESLAIARKRNDKSQELKTMTVFARLVARKSKDQARTMLAETYNWFTEGFDTFYLKEAKALLDELSA